MELNLEEIERQEESPYIERFEEFFNLEYKKEIEKIIESYPESKSLIIDYKILERFDPILADELVDNPDAVLEAAHKAISEVNIPSLNVEEFKPFIRFSNLPKDSEPDLRNISSKHLGKMIAVEGLVRQITDVLPKLTMAVWKCKRCGNIYRVPQEKQKVISPGMCECHSRDFDLAEEQSGFSDYQKVQIQEPLEKLTGNEQAVYIDIYVSDDLVNKVSAGDKTKFVGMLRLVPPQKDKKTVYGRFLECNYLEETQKEFTELDITKEEEDEIRKLSTDTKIYEKLTASVAPAIYGHDIVKESIVLQLFGGVTKHLPNNQTIRGNVHVLLIGDPGCGKSQLLQATNNIAPKSIYFSGKTSSAAGLTATAVKDEFGEGGWTLKAGALVLASGGICMADELDKMDPQDRSALHEAMEQGMISIAKAGIISRFKTDTSLLAAANPKYSRFDKFQPLLEQIELPASLISRFDLFFMIRDILDRTMDQKISEHILKTHQSGEKLRSSKKTGKALTKEEREHIEKITEPQINDELLRKYIAFARQNCFPVLSEDSMNALSEFYVSLRDQGRNHGTYAATARQLEGLVRLAEASARVRLKDIVEIEDAEKAIMLVKRSLEDTVVDPETGKIDIDIVTSGTTHTKQNAISTTLRIIKDAMSEGIDMVPIEQVVAEAMEKGVAEDKVMSALADLEKKGDIYKPRHHYVKPTGNQK
ncbi:MAG: minichromosome maintenance protein MCM [Candidatus Diapherotrites archaeon]|jgi:replicative DNA helicase Mcm|uniref:DNA helicase n=1 Tax=Candidatus Iainarchaeum sp. TaxID=3101447 RepID=A0A8T5GE10_9ARCH|nr:minichromosome maintenance protein MCM [Candidatus Diapherotrites archaeon]MBT7240928.1 minichromosome maintenance protein MCM [Candidatus Diapherotrites archaeon]